MHGADLMSTTGAWRSVGVVLCDGHGPIKSAIEGRETMLSVLVFGWQRWQRGALIYSRRQGVPSGVDLS